MRNGKKLFALYRPAAGGGREPAQITWMFGFLLAAAAGAGYWFAFAMPWGAAGIFATLLCICLLGRLQTSRSAFYFGLLAGMAMYVPHLLFFKSIFGITAALLWLIAGFPIGIFVMLLSLARRRLGSRWAMWLTPVLWTGVEYFRSELYYLRFAWLLPGQAAAFLPGIRLEWIGVYGLGFLYVSAAAMIVGQSRAVRAIGVIASILMAVLMYWPKLPAAQDHGALHVAGIQLEFPTEKQAADALDRLADAHPEAQVLVMSEYTFLGTVPPIVRDVLRKHHRYLIAGGMRDLKSGPFYDTAFVVGPDGADLFEQAKSVPVQFMDDGLPAPQRRVWDSSWGKIGIAVCYDISYSHVMDDFVRQGAQALIVPTMDVEDWGEYERRMLHGRLALVRAAEYGIPIFSVWSSGESQLVDRTGRLAASASYPGQGEMIAGSLDMQSPGHVPLDRYLCDGTVVGTGLIMALLLWDRVRRGDRGGKARR